jgi:hypothetical protein
LKTFEVIAESLILGRPDQSTTLINNRDKSYLHPGFDFKRCDKLQSLKLDVNFMYNPSLQLPPHCIAQLQEETRNRNHEMTTNNPYHLQPGSSSSLFDDDKQSKFVVSIHDVGVDQFDTNIPRNLISSGFEKGSVYLSFYEKLTSRNQRNYELRLLNQNVFSSSFDESSSHSPSPSPSIASPSPCSSFSRSHNQNQNNVSQSSSSSRQTSPQTALPYPLVHVKEERIDVDNEDQMDHLFFSRPMVENGPKPPPMRIVREQEESNRLDRFVDRNDNRDEERQSNSKFPKLDNFFAKPKAKSPPKTTPLEVAKSSSKKNFKQPCASGEIRSSPPPNSPAAIEKRRAAAALLASQSVRSGRSAISSNANSKKRKRDQESSEEEEEEEEDDDDEPFSSKIARKSNSAAISNIPKLRSVSFQVPTIAATKKKNKQDTRVFFFDSSSPSISRSTSTQKQPLMWTNNLNQSSTKKKPVVLTKTPSHVIVEKRRKAPLPQEESEDEDDDDEEEPTPPPKSSHPTACKAPVSHNYSSSSASSSSASSSKKVNNKEKEKKTRKHKSNEKEEEKKKKSKKNSSKTQEVQDEERPKKKSRARRNVNPETHTCHTCHVVCRYHPDLNHFDYSTLGPKIQVVDKRIINVCSQEKPFHTSKKEVNKPCNLHICNTCESKMKFYTNADRDKQLEIRKRYAMSENFQTVACLLCRGICPCSKPECKKKFNCDEEEYEELLQKLEEDNPGPPEDDDREDQRQQQESSSESSEEDEDRQEPVKGGRNRRLYIDDEAVEDNDANSSENEESQDEEED